MTIRIDVIENGIVTLSSPTDEEIHFIDEEIVELVSENVSILSGGLARISSIVFAIKWDEVGDRTYETGLDRGVLYLSDGSAVPWNGLTSINETFDKESSPVYFDGMKINDLVTLGSFSGTMKAITYPDEFVELEGIVPLKPGAFASDQKPKTFGLSYRTLIGNDIIGQDLGYKIHIIYNLTAIPNDKSYNTITDNSNASEFEWDITAIPEDIPGFRPTAHFIINSIDVDPWLLEDLEKMLYGSITSEPSLISMNELVSFILGFNIRIIDNDDGTWTAISRRDESIEMLTEYIFQIHEVNATFLDEDTFVISDT